MDRAFNGSGPTYPIVPPRRWPAERVIDALQEDARRRGRPPRYGEWEHAAGPGEPDRPAAQTVRRLFGSWSAGLAQAGLTAEDSRQ